MEDTLSLTGSRSSACRCILQNADELKVAERYDMEPEGKKDTSDLRRMEQKDRIGHVLRRLRKASPAGFAIALHVKFTAPRYLFQAYDKDWLDAYNRDGLVMHDPTVKWAFENTGTVRWSELAASGPVDVFERAARHGLAYGLTVSVDDGGSRSMASFARSDRELTAEETEAVLADVKELHRLTRDTEAFSPRTHETLKQLSVFLTRG